MKHAIILSGVSRAGKSAFARKNFPNTHRISADDFFKTSQGGCEFSPLKLEEAHNDCFRKFLVHLASSEEDIIVDNSNTMTWQISPYVLAAKTFDFSHEIITLVVPWEKLEELDALTNLVSKQYHNLVKRVLPPFWNAREIRLEAKETIK